MNRKLNILFLASWYPNRTNPYHGNFVQRHARAVSEYCNVSVLHACSDSDCKEKYELSIEENAGIREVIVYYKKVSCRLPGISQLQKYLRNKKALKLGFQEVQKNHRTDLIHLNVTFPAGLFALNLKKNLNLQYILTEHWTIFLGSDPSAFPRGSKKAILNILKQASVICPVSYDLQKALKVFAPGNTYQVVNNVVDTDLFSIREHENPRKRILHVSTLAEEQKNISGILRVIKKLSEVRNDFEILIVGDGDISPHRSYAESLGLLENKIVEFKGKQDIEIIAQIMQDADIFLLFSHYENLPCVIIEAHASGLPVISSEVGGIAEMINDQNGVLVSPADEDMLLEKLNHMLDNYHTFDREKIRDEAVQKYSYSVIGKQFNEIYKNIIP